MKRNIKKLTAILLGILLMAAMMTAGSVMAAEGDVDFYVRVSGGQGSVNFRSGPGTGYSVIREIPNGTTLHITDMSYNSSNGWFFGKTEYNGSSGWVSLRQTSILSGNGYAAPDFQVRVSAQGGSLNLRRGPGTSYGAMLEIPNGTTLHITNMQYNANDDFFFGSTEYNGMSGWVSLRQTTLIGRGSTSNQGSTNTGTQTPATGTTPAPAAGTTPTPVSGNTNSTGSNPVPVSDTGNSPTPAASTPVPVSGTNNGTGSTPVPVSGTDNGTGSTPVPVTGTNNETGSTQTPATGTTTGSDEGVKIVFGESMPQAIQTGTAVQASDLPQGARDAYLDLLRNNGKLMNYSILDQYYEGKIISFEDITGDGIQEMLCVYVEETGNQQYGKYRIASWQNGQLGFIKNSNGEDFSMFIPGEAGCLFPFMVEGNTHLFLKDGRNGTGGDNTGECFDIINEYVYENGYLKEAHTYEYNTTQNSENYQIDGNAVTSQEAGAKFAEIEATVSKVLAGDMEYYAYTPSGQSTAQNTGMSYDDAVAFLEGQE